MSRRIVGIDLNGRFDLAARDWGEDVDKPDDDMIRLLQGGTCGSVVTTLDGRLVAGPQAALAPHGRGDAWGDVGKAHRRRSLAAALDDQTREQLSASDVRAAVDALTRGGEDVVAAVPDLESFAEAAQGAMIAAMSARRRRVRLLWRSVAVFLDLLDAGTIEKEMTGARFRILLHGAAGLEDQVLTLIADPEHHGHHAPRRDAPGRLFAPCSGLDALFAQVRVLVAEHNPGVVWARCEPSRLGPKLLTGEVQSGEVEVLRAWNANWVAVTAPEIEADDLDFGAIDIPPPGAPVASTFLVTPLASSYAERLARSLASALGPVTIIGPEAVARGCLLAGRLIERGMPHYFDRLEPVAIAVMRGDEPVFEHLIQPGAVVPANREYVSEEIGGFEWGRGRGDSEFYVLKGYSEVRHWKVSKALGPSRSVPVTLKIRQTPGQSWARLTVSSHEWEALARSPVALDWETLTPLELTPEQVLEKLRTPEPGIPDPILEEPHIGLWTGEYWAGNGLASELARSAGRGDPVSPTRWVSELRRSRRHPEPPRERFWHVGTDGSLPEELSSEICEGFRVALEQMGEMACSATLRQPLRNNDLLMALTWCFARCPEPVQDRIIDALEADSAGRSHPFTTASFSLKVLRQGAGRAVSGVPRLTRLFRYLESAPVNNDTINALAMALSRRPEAPEALTREQVDHFLQSLGQELLERVRRRQLRIRFRNTLSAIAGLFRWRVREPYALLAGRDPVAAQLRETLVLAKVMLEGPGQAVPQREQKSAQIDGIIAFLDGRGDPDILRLIEADDEEEDEKD